MHTKLFTGYGMKKTLTLLLAFFSLAISQHAVAQYCHQMSDAELKAAESLTPIATPVKSQAFQLAFPSAVEIAPDLAVGSVIASGVSNSLSGPIRAAVCGPSGGSLNWIMANRTEIAKPIYQTNIAGVGLRLTYVRASGTTSDFEFPVTVPPNTGGPAPVYLLLGAGVHFKADLIKTGDIANNVDVLGGAVGSVLAEDGNAIVTISSNLVNIKIKPDCSVSSSNINIDFGTFGPRNVTTTSGPSRPVNFKLACSGITLPPKSVTATLSGTPDPINASLIKNNGDAQNLAIQLADVATGTVLSPNNAASKLVQIPSGLTSDFALTAQVLRVGTAAPTAGSISAIATITLNVE